MVSLIIYAHINLIIFQHFATTNGNHNSSYESTTPSINDNILSQTTTITETQTQNLGTANGSLSMCQDLNQMNDTCPRRAEHWTSYTDLPIGTSTIWLNRTSHEQEWIYYRGCYHFNLTTEKQLHNANIFPVNVTEGDIDDCVNKCRNLSQNYDFYGLQDDQCYCFPGFIKTHQEKTAHCSSSTYGFSGKTEDETIAFFSREMNEKICMVFKHNNNQDWTRCGMQPLIESKTGGKNLTRIDIKMEWWTLAPFNCTYVNDIIDGYSSIRLLHSNITYLISMFKVDSLFSAGRSFSVENYSITNCRVSCPYSCVKGTSHLSSKSASFCSSTRCIIIMSSVAAATLVVSLVFAVCCIRLARRSKNRENVQSTRDEYGPTAANENFVYSIVRMNSASFQSDEQLPLSGDRIIKTTINNNHSLQNNKCIYSVATLPNDLTSCDKQGNIKSPDRQCDVDIYEKEFDRKISISHLDDSENISRDVDNGYSMAVIHNKGEPEITSDNNSSKKQWNTAENEYHGLNRTLIESSKKPSNYDKVKPGVLSLVKGQEFVGMEYDTVEGVGFKPS